MRDGMQLVTPTSLSERYPGEERRWVVLLGLPAVGAAICVAIAVSTSHAWVFGGAVLLGPGGVLAAIVYLALSTDTSGG